MNVIHGITKITYEILIVFVYSTNLFSPFTPPHDLSASVACGLKRTEGVGVLHKPTGPRLMNSGASNWANNY